jgi:hypothetical protein
LLFARKYTSRKHSQSVIVISYFAAHRITLICIFVAVLSQLSVQLKRDCRLAWHRESGLFKSAIENIFKNNFVLPSTFAFNYPSDNLPCAK